jgi:flagellar assembly protein FliH
MSSSKIIKSLENVSDGLTEFSFKPIGQLVISAPDDASAGFTPMAQSGESTGFVRMGLFDTSENDTESLAEEEVPQEPPGITLSEEELDQRLRESFQSGLQEGKKLAERGLLNVFTSLRSAAESLHGLREKVLRESEDELIKLVMLVARKVIQREVTQDRQILLDVVRAATATISAHDEIVIRLHPDDYAMVTTSREDYFRQELSTDRMQLKSDPEISPGSCRVDTEMGTIDASIDSQLDEIFRRLQEERSMTSGNGA